jgi:hypothetical protein
MLARPVRHRVAVRVTGGAAATAGTARLADAAAVIAGAMLLADTAALLAGATLLADAATLLADVAALRYNAAVAPLDRTLGSMANAAVVRGPGVARWLGRRVATLAAAVTR